MTPEETQALAVGAQAVTGRTKADMQFTCAARDEESGDLYLGSTYGVVIVSGKKTHHVKLQGEAMQACAAGPDGVWFAGPASLVRFEVGQARTHKLARSDFGIAAGAATALLTHGGRLWLGVRSASHEPVLYRLDVASRRIGSYPRNPAVTVPRGLAVCAGQVHALTDIRLLTPEPEGTVMHTTLHLSGDQTPLIRESERDTALMAQARRLVDAPFLAHDGDGLVGRDSCGLFLTRSLVGPVEEPWPAPVALLGSCALRYRGSWLIGTPLGLIWWDGAKARRLGTAPVVALIADGWRVLVVGRTGVAALEGDLPESAPELEADLAPALPLLASDAVRTGGSSARLAGLRMLAQFVPGDADATALVLESLDDSEVPMRLAAIDIVQKRHLTAGQDRVFAMLTDKHPNVRGRAIRALLTMGDPRAAANLVEALRELNAEEARGLIRDLTSSASAPSVDVLRPFVLDSRPVVRRSALLWLGKLGFPQPLLGAIAQLERHKTEDREKGARNLAQLRDPLVVYLLAAHLSDPAPSVRREALFALAEVSVELEVPEEAYGLVSRAMGRAMAQTPDDPQVCRAVVLLAEHVGHTVPRELVERAIRHAAPESRAAAVQAVEKQRRRDMLPELMACLHDPDVQVRGAAVEALGRMGDPRALSSLLDLLYDPLTFRHRMRGEDGNRAVTRAMARILAVDVPHEVEVGRHEVWAAWFRERILPLLERFGLARRPMPGQ